MKTIHKTIHLLKTDIQYYRAAERGDKPFEIRLNDRGYQKGDIVNLLPYEEGGYVEPYDGLKFEITYVIGFQQKENWVVFGIRPFEGEH